MTFKFAIRLDLRCGSRRRKRALVDAPAGELLAAHGYEVISDELWEQLTAIAVALPEAVAEINRLQREMALRDDPELLATLAAQVAASEHLADGAAHA